MYRTELECYVPQIDVDTSTRGAPFISATYPSLDVRIWCIDIHTPITNEGSTCPNDHLLERSPARTILNKTHPFTNISS